MRAAVIVFPGTNCERETLFALQNVLHIQTSLVWHDDIVPTGVDWIVLPGGFSFGDHLRAGAIARMSPMLEQVRRHAQRGGGVLGICNGFQILTEARLLPGALTQNENHRFVCKNVFVRAVQNKVSAQPNGDLFQLPIAHHQGRYYIDREGLTALQQEGRIALQYCDSEGNITSDSNPNGSVYSIAGIYGGPAHTIVGLMPHPERNVDEEHQNIHGRLFLENILNRV